MAHNLVIDWSHNPELPKTTITPLYEKEKEIWKEILGAYDNKLEL